MPTTLMGLYEDSSSKREMYWVSVRFPLKIEEVKNFNFGSSSKDEKKSFKLKLHDAQNFKFSINGRNCLSDILKK